MIVGLKGSIPCAQVISRNNNNRNYLNEQRRTHLIFYLSEGAVIRDGGEGGGRSFKPGHSLNFFSCKEGRSFEGGIHLGRGAVSDNYGSAAWLRDELFECLDPRSNLSRTRFISHYKFV